MRGKPSPESVAGYLRRVIVPAKTKGAVETAPFVFG
jgi:hypothetical protein